MFNGEIVFAITDEKQIEVDLGTEIKPTRIIARGDVVALGKKAPKYRWIYEIKYNGEKEYFESLEKMIDQLYEKKESINQLTEIYEEVSITIYIGSEFAQIGYSIPSHILKKISLLECELSFDILSFGMVEENMQSTIYEMINNIKSKNDFISFLISLSNDNLVNNDEWENKDISSYLESISSWVEDMEGYYENMKLNSPVNINWKFIATLFYVGKIYE